MPSFNSIARAAVTPGGFQAGVNDIVAAVLNADAQKAKLAQQQAMRQGDQSLEQAKLSELIRHNQAGEASDSSQFNAHQGFQEKSLGETIRHNTAMESKNPYSESPSMAAKRGFDEDLAAANLEVLGNPEGDAWIPQSSTDILGNTTTKQVKGPVAPDLVTRRNEIFKQAQAKRAGAGNVLHSSGVAPPKAGTEPVSPGARPTPVAGAPAPVAQPAIDYEAMDRKLQATDPAYRQRRANPNFPWKQAIDAYTKSGGK